MSTVTRGPEPGVPAQPATDRPPCRESGAAAAGAAGFDRLVFRDLPLAILAAATVSAMAAGAGWTEAVGPWIWIVSLVLVGLPHGAADLAIGRLLAGRSIRELFLGGLLYLAGMACVASLFAVSPVGTVVLFSLVSIWHFGIGHRDTEPDGGPEKTSPRSVAGWAWPADAVAAMARAGAVLGVPAVAWPHATAEVADRLVTLLHAGDPSRGPFFDEQAVHWAGLALVAVSIAAIVVEAVIRRGRGIGWLAIEVGTFAALAWVADPLFSVGLYYLAWHAWRHMRSLTTAGTSRSLAAAVAQIHLLGLPLLVPTCAALGGLWWLLSPTRSPRDLAILSIGVYLIVTPSHDVLVRRFRDRRGHENIS